MKEFWDERYSKEDYAYGTEPNNYLKEQLQTLPAGSILFPAEGEGRNAVYAAKLGWNVVAFDISAAGKKKAMTLAEAEGVSIDYQVGSLESLKYEAQQFDALALIYAHFPADLKSRYHKLLDTYVRPGGWIVFEAFSKSHLAYNSRNEQVGGPKDVNVLFSVEEVQADFPNYEIIQLEEQEVVLNEGLYHKGLGSVIRFKGRKK
jgi:2-polyprenyl-3-methyl-5-hydroxy-6-metoxy-1,4-benzoquinol methylase